MKFDLITVSVLLCTTGFAQLAAGESREQGEAHETAPLALTPAEYNNTIADLLGFPRDGEQWPQRPPIADRLSPRRAASKGVFSPPPPPPVWPWRFPAEPGSDGFEGIAQGQSPSSYQVEELHLAAMHFGSFALLSPTFFTCADWLDLPPEEQATCAQTSILGFAERAYRRPLRTEERDRIKAFWQANLKAGPGDEAVALTVAAILQGPAFHFKLEPEGASTTGADSQLGPWELATRLSYFLWDSMPDEELFEAARSGDLETREGIERQARRMLEDKKARPALVHFHHQWLGTDQVLLIAPARRAFGPRFGLTREVKNPRDDDTKWPALMGPIRHSMKLETELFVEEAIFDGEGTFTALMTGNHGYVSDATAPIYGASATRSEGRPSVTRQIEYVSASIGRKAPLTLYPAGFAFEHYDAMGAWRAEDNGQPVDASGALRLPGAEELVFTDGVDFAHQLAASNRVRDCYALHWTRYALGNQLERTAPGIESIQKSFREDDSIKELLVSIAASDIFRTRSG